VSIGSGIQAKDEDLEVARGLLWTHDKGRWTTRFEEKWQWRRDLAYTRQDEGVSEQLDWAHFPCHCMRVF
jgi:hypothetical protein